MLKSEPSEAVRTLDELFAIAQAMEHEAATRYAELAGHMREQGAAEVAEVFSRLAQEEKGHVDSVVRWSEKRSGKAPDPAAIRWELPETFDDETAREIAGSRLVTPYRALSMAVRNEERAFAFWSYVAAHAEAPEIRQAAETMAHEELGHVSLLRRLRRQAYHAERRSGPPGSGRPVVADFGGAAELERRLSDWLEGLAARLTGDSAARARDLAAQARDMANEVQRAAPAARSAAGEEWEAVTAAEHLVESYLEIADRSGDEATVAKAQSLAERAIARLAWMRALARS